MNRAQKRAMAKAERRGTQNKVDKRYLPPALDEFEQFDSIERLFQQLRNGAIEFDGKHYVIMGLHGERYAVLPALEGWMAYWNELAERHGQEYDDSAMQRLAKSLEYDKPLQPEEVEAAYQVLQQQRRMFRTIPRKEIARVAIEVKQRIQRDDEIKDLMRAAA